MSVNLITTVQHNLGYPPLHKANPNTQEAQQVTEVDKFGQAAIPGVITGLYRYIQSDEGATAFLNEDGSSEWVSRIFRGHKNDVIATISSYADQNTGDPVEAMNMIANEAVKVARTQLPATAGVKDVKLFFRGQRNNILPYLPAALHMGEWLHDETLDDNTNKMEGPVSSMMKGIGSIFSSPVTDEDIQKKENNY
jgi:hypothetical protein